jgi:prenyltransferase beta subunit
MTYLYFIVGSAALLKILYKPPFNTSDIIEWVYNQQMPKGGFRCGPIMGLSNTQVCPHDYSNIASNYSALCILKMCGDNFSRVNITGIQDLLKTLNADQYKFNALPFDSECDTRFTYCGVAIANMINDNHSINKSALSNELLELQAFDGGFSWCRHGESHAGITYCAIASLNMLGTIHQADCNRAISWLEMRNDGGWSGRVGKYPDSCYSFWNIGSLANLGALNLVDANDTEMFLLYHQKKTV